MNIKSFLLGSAAALIAVSGARAADAVVLAEPEPVEYVRVCDVYGNGYFYIPGTETCLKIGGYYRFEVRNIGYDRFFADANGDVHRDKNHGYTTRARFAPTFTAKSETELGTLTGYARVFSEYNTLRGGGSDNETYIDHMQISLSTENGTFLVGIGDTPYSRFLDYSGPTIFDGNYGFNNTTEISYTFTGGNGFEAIIAAVENPASSTWDTNIEGGIKFTQAWGMIGAIAGYDAVAENWGAQATLRYAIPNTGVDLFLQGFYSKDNGNVGAYTITDSWLGNGQIAEWSIMGGGSVALTEKIGLATTIQWFDTHEWAFAVGLPFSPVANLSITPEVYYDTVTKDVAGIVRFQRSF